MHKSIVIILSFTILFQSSNFEIKDINKVPILVEHFISHVEDGDSFSDFISLHYGCQVNMHKSEHKEHKELPFKHKHLETHFQYVYTLLSQEISTTFKEIQYKEHKFAYNEPTSNLFVNSFLQPPQI
ncbi:hypothetical protein [Lutibacter sp.]